MEETDKIELERLKKIFIGVNNSKTCLTSAIKIRKECVDNLERVKLLTKHLLPTSLSEMIYLLFNDLNRPKCIICGEKYTNFTNRIVGYQRTCGRKYATVIQIKTSRENDGYKKARAKQKETMHKGIDPITGKTFMELAVEKRLKTMDERGSRSIMSFKVKEHFKNHPHPLTNKTLDEYHGTEKAKEIKEKISENTRLAMLRVQEDGVSVAQRINRKRVHTMRNDIDENGIDAIEKTTKKILDTKIKDIDEKGLNCFQRSNRKRVETMKNDIDENGLNAIQRTNKKVAINSSKTMRNKYNNLFRKDITAEVFLYIFLCKELNMFKIGWTENLDERKNYVEKHLNKPIQVVETFKHNYQIVRQAEIDAHQKFDNYNTMLAKGVNGRTEWFSIECLEECLTFIKELKNGKNT